MHKLVRVLVEATDKEEAMDKATDVMEQLTEREVYDWYVSFEDDFPTSGKNRWGEYEPVYPMTSEMGKKLIDDGIDATIEELNKALDYIREELAKKTNTEILKDYYLQSKFATVGSNGEGVWIYDEWAEPIKSKEEVEEVTKGIEYRFWVVPFDVHL